MKQILCRLPAARRALLLALPTALLLAANACQPADQIPAPAQLLPPDKMVSLLIELHTLEARTDGTAMAPDSTLALFREQQAKIYWHHNVTDSAFVQSFRYYAIHNQDLNDIYKTVIDSLAARDKKGDAR